MTRTATAIFGVLVAATFAAFFVAQRIKSTPSLVQRLYVATGGTPGTIISPNGDGRRERARITVRIKEADTVDLVILDDGGDLVRTLVDGRRLRAFQTLETPGVVWDGRDDEGRLVPDGRYRVRLTLRGAGRSIVSPRSIVKDTVAPRPAIASMGPGRAPGPELLPGRDGEPAVAHFNAAAGYASRIRLFRTGPGAPREAGTFRVDKGARSWSWDGTLDGEPAPAGTYLAVLSWRDQAGNTGTSVPLDRAGLPILGRGPLPGRGGITVRTLAVQAPVVPTLARERRRVLVDSRLRPYSWSVRRMGGPVRGHNTAPKTTYRLTVEAPGGKSGVYLLEIRSGDHEVTVPFPVQARRATAGTAEDPRGVLVVLPTTTWLGQVAADDDGDGRPDTLALGGPVRLPRLQTGLPDGFTEREAPLLVWLDRTGREYDLTTDLALAQGTGPRLTGHRGVLIAGDARWLPTRVRQNLRTFAREGGTVVSVGIDSLRRAVTLGADGGVLSRPTPQRAVDLFGATFRPLEVHTTDLENFEDTEIGLFEGGEGLIPAVPAWESSTAGQEADEVASAVTVDPADGRKVVLAVRFGEGLVIRPGFPAFTQRLATDPAVSALMARMWTLLAR